MTLVAVGDVHGCYQLLYDTLTPYFHTNADIILLGDLIDRSPEKDGDAKVLAFVKSLVDDPSSYGLFNVTVLRGNHEQMLLDAIDDGIDSSAYDLWVLNGGDPAFYKEAGDYYEFLNSLPHYRLHENLLFVHAGVRPDVPLEDQSTFDFMWIREPFLSKDHGLPYTVVHGHTIVDEPEFHEHRINLDTGAYATGLLSAAEFS